MYFEGRCCSINGKRFLQSVKYYSHTVYFFYNKIICKVFRRSPAKISYLILSINLTCISTHQQSDLSSIWTALQLRVVVLKCWKRSNWGCSLHKINPCLINHFCHDTINPRVIWVSLALVICYKRYLERNTFVWPSTSWKRR